MMLLIQLVNKRKYDQTWQQAVIELEKEHDQIRRDKKVKEWRDAGLGDPEPGRDFD